jgi:hypothetical protein
MGHLIFGNFQVFLGWAVVINIALMLVSLMMILLCRNWVYSIHQKMFEISKQDLDKAYFTFLANYKILNIVFFMVPYFCLCLIK